MVLNCVRKNVLFTANHVIGVENVLPDRLSRFLETKQMLQEFGMRMEPEEVPGELLPNNFVAE